MTTTIALAPNAFKGSLAPDQAARAMAEGVLRADPGIQVIQLPVSDGGDGLIPAVHAALGGVVETAGVQDPCRRDIAADYLYIESRSAAVIEMALASGLALLEEERRDPGLTTSYGTGQLILDAMDKGAEQILLGIGGSATCDGGMGAAAALGYRFLDKDGKELSPVGNALNKIHAIDYDRVDPRLDRIRISVACDVTNPLTGPQGAAHVFAPQKGATPAQVLELDRGLARLARIIKSDLGVDVESMAGAGAAGGLGAGMKAFFKADLKPGIDLVLDLIDFRDRIQKADLVITGEGCMDGQTVFNKAPAGVAAAARSLGIPCLAVCGSIGEGARALHDIGIQAIFSTSPGPILLETAMEKAYDLLARATEQAARAFLIKRTQR